MLKFNQILLVLCIVIIIGGAIFFFSRFDNSKGVAESVSYDLTKNGGSIAIKLNRQDPVEKLIFVYRESDGSIRVEDNFNSTTMIDSQVKGKLDSLIVMGQTAVITPNIIKRYKQILNEASRRMNW